MANLNDTDLLIIDNAKSVSLKKTLELMYGFKIIKTHNPSYISLTSRKATLETNMGKFFLKEKPLYCSDTLSMQRSSFFQDFCSKKIHFIPKIIRTKDNNFYFEFENRKYFLQEYINGRLFNGSKKDISRMLDIINELNIAGKKFLDHTNLPKDTTKKFNSFEIATLIPTLDKFIKNEKDRFTFNKIQTTFDNLKNEYNLAGNSSFVMAHSDCILFNFIFSGDKTYLIDFDNTKVLPRIHDIAEFFVSATSLNYITDINNLKRPVLTKPNKIFLKIILSFYKKKFNFTKKEILLFPIIVDVVWLWTLCLSILKEDYRLEDIERILEIINDKTNREETIKILS